MQSYDGGDYCGDDCGGDDDASIDGAMMTTICQLGETHYRTSVYANTY